MLRSDKGKRDLWKKTFWCFVCNNQITLLEKCPSIWNKKKRAKLSKKATKQGRKDFQAAHPGTKKKSHFFFISLFVRAYIHSALIRVLGYN